MTSRSLSRMEHGLPGIKINKVEIKKYQMETVSSVPQNQIQTRIQAIQKIQTQVTMMIKVEMIAMRMMIVKT